MVTKLHSQFQNHRAGLVLFEAISAVLRRRASHGGVGGSAGELASHLASHPANHLASHPVSQLASQHT